MANGTKNRVGRPTEYTPELSDKICEKLSAGLSLRTALAEIGDEAPSAQTVFSWMGKHKEFLDKYTRAKQEGVDAMAEDLLDISDDGSNDLMTIQKGNRTYEIENKEVTNRSRLRVDTRKWLMSKMKPKKYADHIDVTSGGEPLPQPILHVLNNDSGKKDLPTG